MTPEKAELFLMAMKEIICNYGGKIQNLRSLEGIIGFQSDEFWKEFIKFFNLRKEGRELYSVTPDSIQKYRELGDEFWELIGTGGRYFIANSHGLTTDELFKFKEYSDLSNEALLQRLEEFAEMEREKRSRKDVMICMAVLISRGVEFPVELGPPGLREFPYYRYPFDEKRRTKFAFLKDEVDRLVKRLMIAQSCPIFFSFEKHLTTKKAGMLASKYYIPLDPKGLIRIRFPSIYYKMPRVYLGDRAEGCGAELLTMDDYELDREEIKAFLLERGYSELSIDIILEDKRRLRRILEKREFRGLKVGIRVPFKVLLDTLTRVLESYEESAKHWRGGRRARFSIEIPKDRRGLDELMLWVDTSAGVAVCYKDIEQIVWMLKHWSEKYEILKELGKVE